MKWRDLFHFSTLLLAATIATGSAYPALAVVFCSELSHNMIIPVAASTDAVDSQQGSIPSPLLDTADRSTSIDNSPDTKISESTIGCRKAALDRTLSQALFDGGITVAEGQDFRNNLDQITANEASLKSQGGGQLTPDQIQTVFAKVDNLNGRFTQLTANRTKSWNGINGLVNDIKQKIADATTAKKLTEKENEDLQSKIADALVVQGNVRDFTTIGSALRLAAALSALGEQVTTKINDQSAVSLPILLQRQEEVNQRLANAIDMGKLTSAMATPLLAQFNNIAAANAKLQASGNTSNHKAELSLAADLETLSAAIKKSKHEYTKPRFSIAQLEYEDDREITLRTYNGKLTAKQIELRRAEYNRIIQLEKTSRANATGLDANAAITIRNDLTTLLQDIKHPDPAAKSN